MSPPDPLGPTRFRTMTWAAILGAALTFATVAAVEALEIVAPEVPLTTPALLAAAGLAGLGLARITWVRNRAPGKSAEPRQAVATLALARAMILAGAAFAGGYLAFALYYLPRWDAPLPRGRVVHGLVAVAASIALAVAGRVLEYACRVPKSDDTDNPDEDADTEL